MEHEVLIEDFDFVVHYLQVNIGDKIIFRLSNRVPLHAEHIIYGVSETKQLCFESEVLHVSFRLPYLCLAFSHRFSS